MLPLIHWFVYVVFLLSGIAIFLRGFFPMKVAVPSVATVNETCFTLNTYFGDNEEMKSQACTLQAKFDRVVFILIDALRADFVLPNDSSESNLAQMKFVRSLIERNETISYVAVAQPPTVTMPRVKALMTGSVPGFVDVMLNFNTAELMNDNVLLQLQRMGKKIVFYGDDTWIHLFPRMFTRHDGTTSFFVTDFTEVDKNVTRHIDSELQQTDWDVLILHYLGLDHIGHLAGPRSPLVQPKLDEMDSMVQKIFNAVVLQDSDRHLCTLVVLCGDHGMSDQGSHGGSSISEISTPLVLMSSLYINGAGLPYSGQKIQQIDLVPTLALLLGFPIPQGSLGVLAIDALANDSIENKLKLAFINAQQLLKVLKENDVNYNNDNGFQHLEVAISMHKTLLAEAASFDDVVFKSIGEKTLRQYLKAMGLMRSTLVSSLVNYDFYSMIVGMASVWLVLLLLVSGNQHSTMKSCNNSRHVFLGLCWLIFSILHISLCTNSCASSILCGTLPFSTVYVATVFIMLISSIFDTLWRLLSLRIPQVSIMCVFWASNVIHMFSLTSSSFVEEEHQTWYFITMTINVLVSLAFTQRWIRLINPLTKASETDTKNTKQHHISTGSKSASFYQEAMLSTWTIAIICRVMRSWNQTGDKWSHLPDVGDWLVRPENKMILSLLMLAALLVAAATVWKITRHSFVTAIFVLASIFIYCHHVALRVVNLPVFYDEETVSKGLIEARITYSLILLQTCLAIMQWYSRHTTTDVVTEVDDVTRQFAKKSLESDHNRLVLLWRHLGVVWTMLMLLLSRPHNVALVSMLLVKRVCVQFSVSHIEHRYLSPASLSLVYMWLGHAAFFYQGNSNSLATIDIGAGYVGLSSYHPVIIGILMFVNTYSGPIYWLLALQEQLAITFGVSRYLNAVLESSYTILAAKALVVAAYIVLVTIQRYHLFVWTVFSPKLLYEASSAAITVVTLLGCLTVAVVVTGRRN